MKREHQAQRQKGVWKECCIGKEGHLLLVTFGFHGDRTTVRRVGELGGHHGCLVQFSSVQSLSRVRLFATPWTAARQTSLSVTNYRSLLKLMSIQSMMSTNHLNLCRPLLLPPSIFPSIRVFSNESVLHIRCPKYWSFSFSVSPSNEYSGLISFRMDWLDLLAVQGTLKSLLQHHSSKASILGRSAFFIVQLSHPCTVALGWLFSRIMRGMIYTLTKRISQFGRSGAPVQHRASSFSRRLEKCSVTRRQN